MVESDFFRRVWAVVARIPFGYVTTYGHIAEFLGSRSSARTVGWALRAARGTHLPCHRVVNRYGALTGQKQFGGAGIMESLLHNEGITFDKDGCVVLARHLWVPGAGDTQTSDASASQYPGKETEATSAP